MLTLKKNDRQELFKKAMLSREKRPAPRRIASDIRTSSFSWTTCFLWLAFGIVSGYILFFSPTLAVSVITVRGESIFPLAEYETLVQQFTQEKYLQFIPKSNFFLLPLGFIEKELYERYPKISQVSLRRIFPSTLELYIDEAPLLIRWCSGGPCYGLRGGKAVNAPKVEDSRYDTVRLSIVDESALPVGVDETLSVEAYFENFHFWYQELPRIITTKIEKTAATPSRHSGELRLITEEGWVILIATDRSAEASLRALQVFLDEYMKNNPDRSALERIDLRVEGKIFFADNTELLEKVTPEEKK